LKLLIVRLLSVFRLFLVHPLLDLQRLLVLLLIDQIEWSRPFRELLISKGNQHLSTNQLQRRKQDLSYPGALIHK